MKKKHTRIIIITIIIIVISLFGYNSYKMVEKQNSKYRIDNSDNKTKDYNLWKKTDKDYKNPEKNENLDKTKIFNFVSNSNDLENDIKILRRNDEVSFHKFDFNKNEITVKSQTSSGEWKKFQLNIKKTKIKESLIGLKGMEFDINHEYCYQVWISTLGNIGYEFNNGQKLVFYGVQELTD